MTEVEIATQNLIDAINNNRNTAGDEIDQVIRNQHRTIQQNFVRSIAMFLDIYRDSDFDMRNEASVKFAKEAIEFNVLEFPYI